MKLVLFDDPDIRSSLLPLTFTRSVADIRVGALKIREKWSHVVGEEPKVLTEPHIQTIYDEIGAGEALLVNSAVLPDDFLVQEIQHLEVGESIEENGLLIAARVTDIEAASYPVKIDARAKSFSGEIDLLRQSWEVFSKNGAQIAHDYQRLSRKRVSEKLTDPHTITYNSQDIFLEKGVSIRAAILNAEDGPIYLGKDVIVSEGAVIKGPFAAGEGTIINSGAKIRQNTSAGPHCRLGGEIKESVFQGYSNKGHEGFVGNSVIGEWCNLGADTNTSNLKNTYQSVKLWDFKKGRFIDSGEQYLGLIMADHAKAGINSMFNTGTVVGVGSNLFGAGYHRNFVPSFAWGGATRSYMTFKIDKFFEVADAVMSRRGIQMRESDRNMFMEIYQRTADYRFWER